MAKFPRKFRLTQLSNIICHAPSYSYKAELPSKSRNSL